MSISCSTVRSLDPQKGEVFQAGSFDSGSAAVNKEWIDQVQIRAGRVQKQLDREEVTRQVARIPDEQKAVFAVAFAIHKVCSTPPYRIIEFLITYCP
jgi:hypothetical protein